MTATALTITVTQLAEALVAAIEAETRTYRTQTGEDSRADEAACSAAGDVVSGIERALLALPFEAHTVPAYALALALCHRRWLIMEASYETLDPGEHLQCRMVDAVLFGSALDGIQMLWHVKGAARLHRPAEAEFSVLREASR